MPSPPDSTVAAGPRRSFARENGAGEVLQTITNLPPFEREQYIRTLIGRWVRWTGIVLAVGEVSRPASGRYVLALREPREVGLVAHLDVAGEEHGSDRLRAGDQVTYEAEIAFIDTEVHLRRGKVIESRSVPH